MRASSSGSMAAARSSGVSTSSCQTICPRRQPSVNPCSTSRGLQLIANVTKDPDGIFKGIPVSKGIIEKRLASKEMAKQNKSYATAMQFAKDEIERETITRREARIPPTEPRELIEFFLNTLAQDMEYEVARCRPMLNDGFFKELDGVLGEARFALTGDAEAAEQQDRVAELEALRTFLTAAAKAVDAAVQVTLNAKDRMKKLLTSRDKKAMILEMAEANEIDAALLDLLKSNVAAAREAGQAEAAEFMEKVLQACAKYAVTDVPTNTATVMPATPELKRPAPAGAGAGGGLILPGSAGSSASGAAGKPAGGGGLIIPGGRSK